MKLYHGSDMIVMEPQILAANRLLDFGEGFYTTTNYDQAVRWAEKVSLRRNSAVQYINMYELEFDEVKGLLTIVEFKKPDEDWLEFICACRSGKSVGIDYDIVIGPVADDNVYTAVKLFETGVLDKEETIKRLKVEELFDQVLFHSEKALTFCKYTNAVQIGGNENG